MRGLTHSDLELLGRDFPEQRADDKAHDDVLEDMGANELLVAEQELERATQADL